MNWFRKRRDELGMTQRDFSIALDMTTSAISAWENDEVAPRLASSPELAKVYKVTEPEMDRQIATLSKRIRQVAAAAK